jgi:hypothetical protein
MRLRDLYNAILGHGNLDHEAHVTSDGVVHSSGETIATVPVVELDDAELAWPLKTPPAEYLEKSPDGPRAELAKRILAGPVAADDSTDPGEGDGDGAGEDDADAAAGDGDA